MEKKKPKKVYTYKADEEIVTKAKEKCKEKEATLSSTIEKLLKNFIRK